MNTLRLNITVPLELGRELKKLKNVSGFIAEAVREKLSRKRQVSHRKVLAKAYRQSAVQESRLNKEWDATIQDS